MRKELRPYDLGSFSEAFIQLLEDNNMSQVEFIYLLSQITGVDRKVEAVSIKKWLAGIRYPSYSKLRATLDLLGYELIFKPKKK